MNNSNEDSELVDCGWMELPFRRGHSHRTESITGKNYQILYHDGQLSPSEECIIFNWCIATASIQASNGNGWTYSHQPMLETLERSVYYQYLADQSDERCTFSTFRSHASKTVVNGLNRK